MAVPEFQSFFLPLLQFASDKKEHSLAEARKHIASTMRLTAEDLNEILPSGKQTRFANRVTWAKVYLSKAKLLETPQRSKFKISERGLRVLSENPVKLDREYLIKFPEFVEFSQTSQKQKGEGSQPVSGDNDSALTPEEIIEKAHQQLRRSLADELLNQVLNNSSEYFERLVVQLLVKMGYGGSIKDAGQAIGKAGDEGVDGIIKEDKLGLDVIYIQAKKWSGSKISRPEIQKFAGALLGKQSKKGVFITTGEFTEEAQSYANKIDSKVILIDGKQLVNFMIDYGLGVSTVETYEIKKIDNDFFVED